MDELTWSLYKFLYITSHNTEETGNEIHTSLLHHRIIYKHKNFYSTGQPRKNTLAYCAVVLFTSVESPIIHTQLEVTGTVIYTSLLRIYLCRKSYSTVPAKTFNRECLSNWVFAPYCLFSIQFIAFLIFWYHILSSIVCTFIH